MSSLCWLSCFGCGPRPSSGWKWKLSKNLVACAPAAWKAKMSRKHTDLTFLSYPPRAGDRSFSSTTPFIRLRRCCLLPCPAVISTTPTTTATLLCVGFSRATCLLLCCSHDNRVGRNGGPWRRGEREIGKLQAAPGLPGAREPVVLPPLRLPGFPRHRPAPCPGERLSRVERHSRVEWRCWSCSCGGAEERRGDDDDDDATRRCRHAPGGDRSPRGGEPRQPPQQRRRRRRRRRRWRWRRRRYSREGGRHLVVLLWSRGW